MSTDDGRRAYTEHKSRATGQVINANDTNGDDDDSVIVTGVAAGHKAWQQRHPQRTP